MSVPNPPRRRRHAARRWYADQAYAEYRTRFPKPAAALEPDTKPEDGPSQTEKSNLQ